AALLDLEQEDVLITIGAEFTDDLDIARLLTFDPELPAGTAPIGRLAGLERVLEGFRIHECKHEYVAGGDVLGDAWNKTVGIELRSEGDAEFDLGGSGTFRKRHDRAEKRRRNGGVARCSRAPSASCFGQ